MSDSSLEKLREQIKKISIEQYSNTNQIDEKSLKHSAQKQELLHKDKGFNLELEHKGKFLDLKIKKHGLASENYGRLLYAIYAYISMVLIILILIGLSVLRLDASILITLLSTTTANIIAIFIIASKWLYSSK